jgi:hypothetical protein
VDPGHPAYKRRTSAGNNAQRSWVNALLIAHAVPYSTSLTHDQT